MRAIWPLHDTFKPQFNSFELSPPSLVRRSEFDDGEDRIRRTAHLRPFSMRFDIDVARADMPILRRWWLEDIDAGRLWFDLPAFVDSDYRTVQARIVDAGDGPWRQRLFGDAFYRVSIELEIRALPRVEDAVFALRVWASRPDAVAAAPGFVADFTDEVYASEDTP